MLVRFFVCLLIFFCYRFFSVGQGLSLEKILAPLRAFRRDLAWASGLEASRLARFASVFCLLALFMAAAVFIWGRPVFLLVAVGIFFLPDLFLLARFHAGRQARRREVRFLKRLFFLQGSLEPVAFADVLLVLREHADYLAPSLAAIDSQRKRSSHRLQEAYQELRAKARDLEVQLFIDNLSQADRIHFKEGLRAVKADLDMQQIIRGHQADRRKQQVELAGIFSSLFLSFWLTYYLIYPWLTGASLFSF